MSRQEPYDWPNRADERRRTFAPEIIDAEYRVVRQRRQRSGPNWPVLIAAGFVLLMLWRLKFGPLLVLAALLGWLH